MSGVLVFRYCGSKALAGNLETRCKYFPVSSGAASLLLKVSRLPAKALLERCWKYFNGESYWQSAILSSVLFGVILSGVKDLCQV
jgi:hypothetical protein